MKLIVDDYEVDIKVKHVGEKNANKETTMYFLNEIVCYFFASANRYESLECKTSAEYVRKCARDIYNFLKSKSYYTL